MTAVTTYPSLDGEAVFVTGGATGIGAALVETFARQGCRVAFIDLDAAAGAALADRVEREGATRPWFREVNVTDVTALSAAIDDAGDTLGPFLGLINNVGDDTRIPPAELNEERWRRCMAVNLDAAFFASRTVFPAMRERGRGSIVNLSSINAILGPPDMPGYVTAKAGLIGMSKALARDYGSARVRVNAILPGWVVTEKQLAKWLTPEAEAEWMKQVALQRRLQPADIAALALFLVADDSAMITGQSFAVDGGRT